MTQTTANRAADDPQCKKLRYRAWHRGTREMDLLLGPFADAVAGSMNEPERAAFERLLDWRDDDLHDLILQGGMAGEAIFDSLLTRLRAFHEKTKS